MKKKNASFPINAWILILFLTFLAFSVKAKETIASFRYAATFIRCGEWVASARTLEGRYAKVVDLQNAKDLGIQSDMKVFLALPAVRLGRLWEARDRNADACENLKPFSHKELSLGSSVTLNSGTSEPPMRLARFDAATTNEGNQKSRITRSKAWQM